MSATPYADAFKVYREAAWPGVLPLPAGRKYPPPAGYTGAAGVDPSFADCQAWAEGSPGANIALRMPRGVIGIDVDAYAGKLGAGSLAEMAARWGELPATWSSTSREDGSRIRFFRVPDGTLLPGEYARADGRDSGIEFIQHHHRYIAAAPSLHPEGRTYAWFTPDGQIAARVPSPGEFPWLPAAWLTGLSILHVVGETAPEQGSLTQSHAVSPVIPGLATAAETHSREWARAEVSGKWAALAVQTTTGNARMSRGLVGLAMTCGHAAPGLGLDAGALRAQLLELARGNGMVGEYGERAVLVQIDNGLRDGLARPWVIPPEVMPSPFPVAPASEAGGVPVDRNAPLDWAAVWAADHEIVRWLPGKLAERGQQVALVGAGKSGKSLVVLDWARCAVRGLPFLGDEARDPIRVFYADRENSQRDIFTRLVALGAAGPADMAGLVYHSFPSWAPLDTERGAAEFLAVVAAEHERAPLDLVILDTASRYIEGDENDSATWLALYRLVQASLKAAGIAGWRLDHFGKDDTRGARGSAAKAQDVDHVWELRVAAVSESPGAEGAGPVVRTDLELVRTHTRSGLGADQVTFSRSGQYASVDREGWLPGGTRHEVGVAGIPGLGGVGSRDPWEGDESDTADAAAKLIGIFRRTFAEGNGGTKAEARSLAMKSDTNPGGQLSRPTFFRAWNRLIEAGVLARVANTQSYKWIPVESRDELTERNASGEFVVD